MPYTQNATLARASGREYLSFTPAGLGSGLPMRGSRVPGQGLRSSGRKRARGDVAANALPFMEISLIMEPLENVKTSITDEFVMQSAMQVPMHQALTCRIEAYGSPFIAPDLRAETPSDNDLEYASCIATQPELEEQPSFNLSRMASLLERNTIVSRNQQLPNPTAMRAGVTQAPMRAATTAPTSTIQQAQAPGVLSSFDEAPAATLSRQESIKQKQQTIFSAAGDLGQRAMASLLGVGLFFLEVGHRAERCLVQQLEAPSAVDHAKNQAANRKARNNLMTMDGVEVADADTLETAPSLGARLSLMLAGSSCGDHDALHAAAAKAATVAAAAAAAAGTRPNQQEASVRAVPRLQEQQQQGSRSGQEPMVRQGSVKSHALLYSQLSIASLTMDPALLRAGLRLPSPTARQLSPAGSGGLGMRTSRSSAALAAVQEEGSFSSERATSLTGAAGSERGLGKEASFKGWEGEVPRQDAAAAAEGEEEGKKIGRELEEVAAALKLEAGLEGEAEDAGPERGSDQGPVARAAAGPPVSSVFSHVAGSGFSHTAGSGSSRSVRSSLDVQLESRGSSIAHWQHAVKRLMSVQVVCSIKGSPSGRQGSLEAVPALSWSVIHPLHQELPAQHVA